MPSVNKMRRRRSGTLNILRTAAKNFSIIVLSLAPPDLRYLADFRGSAPSLFDFLTRAFGKTMRRDAQRFRQFTITENDHIVFGLFDYAASMQKLGRYLFIGLKASIQRAEADFQPALLEDVGKAAFGQTAMQRHLTAFKAYLG